MTAAALRLRSGHVLSSHAARWVAPLTPEDAGIVARAEPPVLDVGCGPGRHVLALAAAGKVALGIDVTRRALDRARDADAPVLERCVFERVPGEGRWATALLLDGNIGITGDPVRLLTRVASLLRPGGVVLAELDPPGTPAVRRAVRLELDGVGGPWFQLVAVAIEQLDELAAAVGLQLEERWAQDGRWFAALRRPTTP